MLASMAGEQATFQAPKQFAIPNFVLQTIMSEIKMSYLEQLGQLMDKNLNEAQVEQIRTYTIQLMRD